MRNLLKSLALVVLVSAPAYCYNLFRSDKSDGSKKDTEKTEVYVNDKTRITLNHPDGLVETRTGGSAAWRNNNPGNLEYSRLAKKFGAVGKSGRWAVFPDYETGQAASIALLKSPKYSNLTVDEAIARRSPPNENNTASLQAKIRKLGNFTGQEKIRDLSAAQLKTLADAIQRTEGWKPGSIFTSDDAKAAAEKKKNAAGPNWDI